MFELIEGAVKSVKPQRWTSRQGIPTPRKDSQTASRRHYDFDSWLLEKCGAVPEEQQKI
jgi:hypothetical protein